MRRSMLAAVLGLVGAAITAGRAEAQDAAQARTVNFGVGGGFSIPVGDAADAWKTGWNVQGTLGFQPAAQAIGFRFDLMYHSLEADIAGLGALEDLAIIAGAGNVVLTVSNYPSARLYVLGGAGVYNVDAGENLDSETKFGLNGGGGVSFRVGPFNPFVEARLHSIFTEDSNTNLIPIVIGLTF
jgi:hypothetical protein